MTAVEDQTGIKAAFSDPVDLAGQILLILGVGGLGAAVGIRLFTAYLVTTLCAETLGGRCGEGVIIAANDVLVPLSVAAGVVLGAGMLISEYGGEQ